MTTSFKTFFQVLLTLLSVSSLPGYAQTVRDAYLQDSRGVVVRSLNFGESAAGNLCWHTGYWTPALAIAECDPDISPKPAPVAKPQSPPAPAPAASANPVVVDARNCSFVETLGADESFAFNKSALQPSARVRLDAVLAKAAGCARITSLIVTGHTDRIGSAAYNQKLSEARAASVAAYLAGKGLRDAQVVGAGKTLPVKACEDSLPRRALVACLAPNRRVTIEVRGTAR